MHAAVAAKFARHADLAAGGATVVEHTADDACWGHGGDGSGRNMPGRAAP